MEQQVEQTQNRRVYKAVILFLVLCLLAAATTFGLYSATTQKVKNTFVATPGIVNEEQFFIKESKATLQNGTYVLDESMKVTENTYDSLVTSMQLPKDPAVTVDVQDGVSAYIFVRVYDGTKAGLYKESNIEWAIDDSNWSLVSGTSDVYVYKNTVVGGEGTELNSVGILKNNLVTTADEFLDADTTQEGLDIGYLSFTATAVQSQGFSSAEEAYNALYR
ncbi:MAG: hypothetical protein ACI4BI_02145 [Anaerotardibacter sp.]